MELDKFNYYFNEGTRKLEPKDYACRYCKLKKTDSVLNNVILPLTRETSRTSIILFESIKYNEVELLVPRCEQCAKIHKQVKLKTWITIITIAIGLGILSIKLWGLFGIFALLVIPAALAFLWDTVRNLFLEKHFIPDLFKGFNNEPLVQAFKEHGWVVGEPLPARYNG